MLSFSILEIVALQIAFVQISQYVNDHDCALHADNHFPVELGRVKRIKQFRLDLRAAHIAPPDKRGNRIGLEESGIEVERFLIKQKRREFARELNSALAS